MTADPRPITADPRPITADPRPEGAGGPADLVVRNGRVYTGDPACPAATSVAIRDGRVAAVGDAADIADLIGPATRQIDALGRRVIPGLNDSHLHIIRGGLNYLLELRWDGVATLHDGLAMLRQQAARTPKGQWVRVVGGWSADQFAERRLPTISELNAAAPDTPVFVLHLYQSAVLNRSAVEAVGFTRDSPNPPGGEIVRGHDGTPTGLLLATPAAGILYATLAKGPTLSGDEQLGSTRHFLRELNRFGLTSAIDAAGGFQNFPDNYAAVTTLAERGELTVRIAYHLFPQTAGQELDDLRRFVTTVEPGDGDEWLRLNGAGENLAWSAADFENFAQPRPDLTAVAATELEAAVRLLLDYGWGFRLHATYDETIRHDLDVFEKVAAEGSGRLGVPWFFDHAETVSEESLDRVAALGGAISVQNRMLFQGRAFVERYGAARAGEAPPIAAMRQRGIVVAGGTDATRVSSYNPWLSLEWLVRGTILGGLARRATRHLVDRETALHLYTAAGAQLTGEGDVKGMLRPGCYADLAILTDDYFSVPEDEISGIESVLTVVGGRVVYAAGDYEGIAPPIPAVSPPWSPVAHFGGFQAAAPSLGLRQARAVAEVAAAADEQQVWQERRGQLQPRPGSLVLDPCFAP